MTASHNKTGVEIGTDSFLKTVLKDYDWVIIEKFLRIIIEKLSFLPPDNGDKKMLWKTPAKKPLNYTALSFST